MNSKAIGEISEAVILAHLLKQGKSVLLPFGNNQRYDMAVDDGGEFERVQVKTGRLRQGCIVFSTASCNGFTGAKTSYKGNADSFMVYCPDNEGIYRVPVEEAPETVMSLRLDKPKNGINRPSIKWAKDFDIVGSRAEGKR